MSVAEYARDRMGPAARFGAICVAGLIASTGAPSATEPVCVVCTSPTAQYSCSLAPSAAILGLGGARLRLRCLREIAERYGHEMCKVNDSPIAACAGTVHMVGEEPANAGGAAATKRPPASAATAPLTTPPLDADDEPPKTVVEMTKRAAGETQAQIEKSGKVVERAARQTWRCVTSLFTNCDAKSARVEVPSASPDQ
jgi:hypothetical protein